MKSCREQECLKKKEISRLSKKRRAEELEEIQLEGERKAIELKLWREDCSKKKAQAAETRSKKAEEKEITRLSNKRNAEDVEERQSAKKRDIQSLKLLKDFEKLNKKNARLLDQVTIIIL